MRGTRKRSRRIRQHRKRKRFCGGYFYAVRARDRFAVRRHNRRIEPRAPQYVHDGEALHLFRAVGDYRNRSLFPISPLSYKHGELNPRAVLIFRLFVFALTPRDALLLDARHRQAADSDRRRSRAVIRELAVVAHGDDIGEIGYYIARDRN